MLNFHPHQITPRYQAGNYSCHPDNLHPATISLHVLSKVYHWWNADFVCLIKNLIAKDHHNLNVSMILAVMTISIITGIISNTCTGWGTLADHRASRMWSAPCPSNDLASHT